MLLFILQESFLEAYNVVISGFKPNLSRFKLGVVINNLVLFYN